MSKVLSAITNVLTGGFLKDVRGILDDTITNKEELINAMSKIESSVQSHELALQKEVSLRHQNDMNSDSWLSKNIRPWTLIYILTAFTILSITDNNLVVFGHQFNVNDKYVSLLGEWGETIMYFYFGGRTIEKGVKFYTDWKNKGN